MSEESKILDTLQSIRTDPSLRAYFFRRAATSSHPSKWLQLLIQQDYFNPANNPGLSWSQDKRSYSIPQWEVLGYLENEAKWAKANSATEDQKKLLEIFDSIAFPKNSQRVANPITDISLLRLLLTFPDEELLKRVHFVRDALANRLQFSPTCSFVVQELLPALCGMNAANAVSDVLIAFLNFKVENNQVISYSEPYWIAYMSKGLIIQLVKSLRSRAPIDVLHVISRLSKTTGLPLSNVWPPRIQIENEHHDYDYEYAIVTIFLRMCEALDDSEIAEVLRELLKDGGDFSIRLGLFLLGDRYLQLKELFWSEWLERVNYPFSYEWYRLLQRNAIHFSDEEIKIIVDKIWSIDFLSRLSKDHFDSESDKVQYTALKRKEWLSAFKELDNDYVQTRLAEVSSIFPNPIEHPGQAIYMEMSTGDETPISPNRLLELSNEEIVKYLVEFKEQNADWGPNNRGLGASLQEAVQQNPEKFQSNLTPFLTIPRFFQYNLFLSFNSLVRNQRALDWDLVLHFAIDIISLPDFWSAEYEHEDYRSWLLGEIFWLIDKGTQSDATAFDESLLPLARKILLSTSSRVESSAADGKDVLGYVLNSTKGKLLVAMIGYSLRKARLEGKESGRWDADIKGDFTNRLDRKFDPDIDFSVVAGEYLSQLCYLDLDWVKTELDRIFLWDPPHYGKAAMFGYLFYTQRVYAELFKLLKSRGHYLNALQISISNPPEHPSWETALGLASKPLRADEFAQHLTHHICIGYLNNIDDIDDPNSLINALLSAKAAWLIHEVIAFIGRQAPAAFEWSKIEVLWSRLFEIAKSVSVQDANDMFEGLAEWIKFTQHLDDQVMVWLEKSAYAIAGDLFAKDFFEELQRLLETDAHNVAILFLRIAEAPAVPEYPPDLIHDVAAALVEAGESEIVKEIKNLYFQKGRYFLNDIKI